MKKRLFAIALSLCMTLSLLPTAAFAAEPGGGGTSTTQGEQSGSLTQQIKQSKDATVNLKLQGDHTESVTISEDKNVVLDLGTYKLSGQGGPAICVEDGATLTIKGTGTVDSSNNDFGNIVNDGTVTIEGNITFDYLVPMNQKKDNATWNVYSNISNHGTMTIKGGTFEYRLQQGQQPDNATWNVYDNIDNFGKLEITGGTFTGGKETIKNNGNGTKATISITGGTFDNDPAQFVATGYGGLMMKDKKYEVLKQAKVNFAPTGGNLTWQVYEGDTLKNNLTWDVYVGATFVAADATYSTFPYYKMEGYEKGNTWKCGETPVNGTTPVTSDMIGTNGIMNLVPDAKKSEEPVTYKITGGKGIENLPTSAKMGEEVTFTVKAAEKGYMAYVSVTDANNNDVTFELRDNQYFFKMPASNVTVAVEYIKDQDVVIDNELVKDSLEISAGTTAASANTKGKDEKTAAAMTAIAGAIQDKDAPAVVANNDLILAANAAVDAKTVKVNDIVKANESKLAGIGATKENQATIVVEPFMSLEVKDAKLGTDGKTVSVTINVTPMVAVKATCTTGTEKKEIVLDKQELKVTKEITMILPVPEGWSQAFVQHKGYVYPGSVNSKAVTFQNPHGFSDFTVTEKNPAVATNNNSNAQYTDLALAINEAQAKDTITLTDKANGANVTTDRDNKTVTLKKADGVTGEVKVTVNGTTYDVTAEGISLTTPRASSGGGGGSSASTGYTVTANSSKNGSVSVTPKNASKGDTVTVTVKADKGYELSKLTVTDKDGKSVKLTDKGNGKYTFTMPGSKVEVKAEFVESTTASENPFRDVSKNAYYYKQVLWAVEKGITSGVSANEFAPEAACTRGQMVTFLWKAAGSPEVSGTLAFNDVSADAYYAKAVRWAAQQGITSGTSAGMFSPNAPCTRGQMAMFLYAYAKNPAVTGSVPFSDVASGDYFNTAVLWAVKNGITSGTSSTTYSPASVCTRGQMVVFLYQLLNK